jgi:hypothetical protein
MSSTLSHSMKDYLIDNEFLTMMLQLLQESQPEERQSMRETSEYYYSREEGHRKLQELLEIQLMNTPLYYAILLVRTKI